MKVKIEFDTFSKDDNSVIGPDYINAEINVNAAPAQIQKEVDTAVQAVIDNFNNTLRPFERARTFSNARLSGSPVKLKHDWTKKSLVTEKGGYDNMVCSTCGATGKRHGLGSGTTIDKKFAKYVFCPNNKVS